MNKFVLLLMLLGLSVSASASSVGPTKINEILIGEDFGSDVYIEVENKPEFPANCSINATYSYGFSASSSMGQILLPLVIEAYTNQKDVYISGTGDCTHYHTIEDISYIRFR